MIINETMLTNFRKNLNARSLKESLLIKSIASFPKLNDKALDTSHSSKGALLYRTIVEINKLSQLRLGSCNINKISLTEFYPNLEYLDLENNFLNTLEFLSQFPKLLVLKLKSNNIEYLKPLNNHTLGYLSLSLYKYNYHEFIELKECYIGILEVSFEDNDISLRALIEKNVLSKVFKLKLEQKIIMINQKVQRLSDHTNLAVEIYAGAIAKNGNSNVKQDIHKKGKESISFGGVGSTSFKKQLTFHSIFNQSQFRNNISKKLKRSIDIVDIDSKRNKRLNRMVDYIKDYDKFCLKCVKTIIEKDDPFFKDDCTTVASSGIDSDEYHELEASKFVLIYDLYEKLLRFEESVAFKLCSTEEQINDNDSIDYMNHCQSRVINSLKYKFLVAPSIQSNSSILKISNQKKNHTFLIDCVFLKLNINFTNNSMILTILILSIYDLISKSLAIVSVLTGKPEPYIFNIKTQ